MRSTFEEPLSAGYAGTAAMPAAIALDDVTLVRRTQEELHYDLKRSALRLLTGRAGRVRRRTVLEGISLRIQHGEKVGVIGPNGSGKSTLLKVIAGILMPTAGRAMVDGTIAPLIELGVGFDLELSLVDNIIYYGVLLGHSEDVVRKHVEPILDFAELGEHREEPTKTLSSGMAARLSFAIATEFRPEVLLIDEVLSVGDERFRRKCAARIDRFWDEHSTILLVSHDIHTVSRTCKRVIWMDRGKVRFDGPSERALELYLETIPSEHEYYTPLPATAHVDAARLVQMAAGHPRGEILVRGTSGHPQIYLIREGHRHAISTPEWIARNGFLSADVVVVEDRVIHDLQEGSTLSA